MIRRDSDRLLEVQFLLESESLRRTKSIQEYYDLADQGIFEYLNPSNSYTYTKVKIDGGFLFKVDKYKNDPLFVVTLKQNGKTHVLDFYWPENDKGFERLKGLEGSNYIDTLVKIIQKEIIPLVLNNKIFQVIFSPYEIDSAGKLRDKIFDKIVDKFVDKNKFTIFKKSGYTIISKKND